MSQPQQPQPDTQQQQPTTTDTLAHPVVLEEDDEFEDFPVEDWPQDDQEVTGNTDHLWEESWDDEDANEDFSRQLREEIKKVEAQKRLR
ncbi:hypothetical protein KEM55_002717 [Ascosphaera atra]|nr:hypothetical protein KEM55_002717 [Ascosphaera atra]